jgi:exonuclease III
LASQPAATRITRCTVLAQFGTSDHAPVVAHLEP